MSKPGYYECLGENPLQIGKPLSLSQRTNLPVGTVIIYHAHPMEEISHRLISEARAHDNKIVVVGRKRLGQLVSFEIDLNHAEEDGLKPARNYLVTLNAVNAEEVRDRRENRPWRVYSPTVRPVNFLQKDAVAKKRKQK